MARQGSTRGTSLHWRSQYHSCPPKRITYARAIAISFALPPLTAGAASEDSATYFVCLGGRRVTFPVSSQEGICEAEREGEGPTRIQGATETCGTVTRYGRKCAWGCFGGRELWDGGGLPACPSKPVGDIHRGVAFVRVAVRAQSYPRAEPHARPLCIPTYKGTPHASL